MTVIPIANTVQSSGYEAAFLLFGLGQGIVVMLIALPLRAPQAGEVGSCRPRGATDAARLRPDRGDPDAGVLGHVCDVRARNEVGRSRMLIARMRALNSLPNATYPPKVALAVAVHPTG
jgi:hypothetical protein